MNVIDLTMIDSDEDAAAPVAPANTGTIDLCYSSSDEAGSNENADPNAGGALKREGATAPPPAKRARAGGADDDVLAVPAPARRAPPAAPQPQSGDDECQITAHQGALTDFPHSREHCTTFPIAADATKRCANCFCYVCDAPASGCKSWAAHCAAVHADPAWRAKRESARRACPWVVEPGRGARPRGRNLQPCSRSQALSAGRRSAATIAPSRDLNDPRHGARPPRRHWLPERAR